MNPVPGTESIASTSDTHIDKRLVSKEGSTRFQNLLEARASTAPAAHEELTVLLQRFCSALYVDADSPVQTSRMLIALDAALPGAAAELIREGPLLRVRLHAGNEAAFRVMSARGDSLNAALGDTTSLDVVVEIVRDEERHDGSDS